MLHKIIGIFPATALLLIASACSSHQTMGEKIDDALITSKIEAKLAADPEVSAFNVDVDTDNGVVRLSGVVKKRSARREAAKLARKTSGVKSVINDITVGDQSLGDRVSDAGITGRVKAKLTADPEVSPFNIDVDTDDRVVTLSGTVGSEDAKKEAESLARSVKDVKDVKNRLIVKEKRKDG